MRYGPALRMALAATIGLTLPMFAQAVPSGTIVGSVTSDSAGAHRVGNVEVSIPELALGVRTDSLGEYRVAAPPGRYLVVARLLGFKLATAAVTVSASTDARLNFVLDQTAAHLGSVVTSAPEKKYISGGLNGFEERMHAHAGGTFIGDSVLRANEYKRLSEVMASRLNGVRFIRPPVAPPGENPDAVWVVGTRSASPACGAFQKCPSILGNLPPLCYASVYVDNVLVFDPRRMPNTIPPDVSTYKTSDIAGVEFYSGPASTPPQFESNPCGVLAIWTREK